MAMLKTYPQYEPLTQYSTWVQLNPPGVRQRFWVVAGAYCSRANARPPILWRFYANTHAIQVSYGCKNPPRREIRCFGELPRGLRDSTRRLLEKWVDARVRRLPWLPEPAKIQTTHATYFACVFWKNDSSGDAGCGVDPK